ncbi:S-adenosyl-L-methionine-dependent methyltransferase [Calycina marina]|uniref:S-adenosyl-L-methionine-dependent methyltransferase n=1 Tax=Calycina marina TaxID=1763456 RepID=A0A9P7Z8R0_9HELO|nr:S-adenosyl-L-methionine-dependent methyltransferase [Calycina marina]
MEEKKSGGSLISSGHTIADAASVEEGGRTFHGYKEGQYLLPNDAVEQNRLDLQHQVFLLLLDDKLSWAPVVEPKYVLDIATGTGMWALEFAEQNPQSHVIGTDLSLIQPSRDGLTNCEFIREDAEDQWIFSHKFDYIHLRAILTCFNDCKAVFQQCFDNLNDGGYIEIQGFVGTVLSDDGTLDNTALARCAELTFHALSKFGKDMFRLMKYTQWLKEIGFVDIVEQRLPAPINTWPADKKFKKIGMYTCADMSDAMEATAAKIYPALGLSTEEIGQLVKQAQIDLRNSDIHAYLTFSVIYAKKPASCT